MQILLANHSSYPRPEEDRSADAVAAVIREQEAAGLDIATDGQLTGAEATVEIIAAIDGVRLGAPIRPFGSRRSIPQPVIEKPLRRSRPLLATRFRHARSTARAQLKVAFTGPYTLARIARIATPAYANANALAVALSEILADEVRELAAAGTSLVQIDEPLILAHPGDVRWLRRLIEPLKHAAGDASQVAVTTFFADAEPLYAQLNSLPADILGLDLTQGSRLIDAVASTGASKVLAFGIVDGGSPALEAPDAAARILDRLLRRYVHDTIYLQPSCGLSHLDRTQAQSKLALLPRIRTRFVRSDGGGTEH